MTPQRALLLVGVFACTLLAQTQSVGFPHVSPLSLDIAPNAIITSHEGAQALVDKVTATLVPTAVPTPMPTEEPSQPIISTPLPIATLANIAQVYLTPTSHEGLMSAAGISAADYSHVDYIVSHESGWRSTVWNKTGSGAYGLGQAMPATKMAAFGDDYLSNPVTQLRWANAYAHDRYGSWYGAKQFWMNHAWW